MIKAVHLRNFCQHDDLSIEFHPRMTAIVGANGSGKSNIFAAIIGSLTNEWVNAGKKEANVTYDSSGPSFVGVDISHNGQEARVRRGLRGGPSYLEFADEDQGITGEDQITQAILDMLGISKRMLMDYTLVRQGAIAGILSTTPAERAKSFQRLFGTERCEAISAACLPAIARLAIPFDLSKEIALSESIVLAEESITVTQGRIASLAEQIPPDLHTSTLKESLGVLVQLGAIDQSIQTAIAGMASSSNVLGALRKDLAKSEALCNEAQETVKRLGGDADEARVKLRLVSEFEKAWAENEKALAGIAEVKDARAGLTSPSAPQCDRPDLAEQAQLQSKLDTLTTLTGAIDADTGLGQCPLCLTEGVDLSQRLKDASVEEGEMLARIQEIGKAKSAYAKYDALQNTHEKQCEILDARIVEREQAIAATVVPDKPEAGEWESIISDHSDAVTSQARNDKLVGAIREKIAAASNGRDVHANHLATAEREKQGLPAVAQTEQEIRDELESIEQDTLAKAGLEGSLSAEMANLESRKAQLATVRQEKKAATVRMTLSDTLSNVRSAFHRDGIPAQVSRSYLNALTRPTGHGSSINELLDVFEAPFTVEVSEEDLSFVVNFNDGRIQPAERLSGGEKVVLSLALRTSINALFASHLSMLFLDEPTEYLDEDNLKCLSTALGKLGQLAEDRGLQVVVITHEANLAPLFDKVIEL